MSRFLRAAATAFLSALILLGVALAALRTARQPLGLGDYVAIWGLKARALYRTGQISSIFHVDPEGAFSHPEYPPLWPLVLAGVSKAAGRYDELALALLAPLLHAVAVALAIAATRARPPFRLLAGAAVALLPYFAAPLYAGYAERLLVVLVLGALAVVPALDRPVPAALFAALLTLAAFTKQEGVLAALVACAALAAARRFRAALATAASVLVLAVLPWAAIVRALAPSPPPRDFALSAFDPTKLAVAAQSLFEEAIAPNAAWLLGASLLLALAPGALRRRRGVLAASALYVAALFGAFAFTRRDPEWLVHWTWDRLVLVPLVVCLVVLAEAAEEAIDGKGVQSAAASPTAPARAG